MKISLVMPAIFGAALLTGCAPYTVRADYDTTTSYAAYKTFNWFSASKYAKGKADGDSSNIMERRIRVAAEKQLTARGFRMEKQADPDFLVVCTPVYHNRPVVTTTDLGGGFGWRPWRFGMGSTVSEVRNFKEGSIVLGIVDYKRNEMIWQAVADGALTDIESPEEADRIVNEAVASMLAKFPPQKEAH